MSGGLEAFGSRSRLWGRIDKWQDREVCTAAKGYIKQIKLKEAVREADFFYQDELETAFAPLYPG